MSYQIYYVCSSQEFFFLVLKTFIFFFISSVIVASTEFSKFTHTKLVEMQAVPGERECEYVSKIIEDMVLILIHR